MHLGKSLGLIILFLSLQACGALRTEFYREETLCGYQNACKHYQQGDYAAAGSGFEGVVAMDPDYGPAHAGLGHLALIREDYPGALAHYRQAIAADPELATDLQPFIMVVLAHEKRAPLRKAGISLDQLYPLILDDRLAEVETILAKDIPLRLLAGDSMCIPPGRLGEMRCKIAKTATPTTGSVRYRLFAGYLLFFGQADDALAAALIKRAADEVEGKDRQEALVVLGQLHERRGEANAAVDAYLAAVDAGLPMTAAAPHLARVYRVDIQTILPRQDAPAEVTPPLHRMAIEVSTFLPPSRAVGPGAGAQPRGVRTAERTGSRHTF